LFNFPSSIITFSFPPKFFFLTSKNTGCSYCREEEIERGREIDREREREEKVREEDVLNYLPDCVLNPTTDLFLPVICCHRSSWNRQD